MLLLLLNFLPNHFRRQVLLFGAVSEISEMDSTNNWDIGGFAIRKATVTLALVLQTYNDGNCWWD